jgi:hypothetical protein
MRRNYPALAAARALLDRAKAGEPVSPLEITEALIETGDLDPAPLIQIRREAGTWELEHGRHMARASWLDPLH